MKKKIKRGTKPCKTIKKKKMKGGEVKTANLLGLENMNNEPKPIQLPTMPPPRPPQNMDEMPLKI
jgi:hypothetical protein